MNLLRLLLVPFSFLYDLITSLRNMLFDRGILPSQSYDTSVISIGNLVAGGTGKTPLAEYLIDMLHEKENIVTLSRGYKRKTKGFVLATDNDTCETIGDEPLQYKRKYKDIHVAVCEKRKKGIETIEESLPETSLIILDDAFQHRYVKPGLSILLTEYHNLFINDWLLPMGRLRESARGRKRADIIVVTKTPYPFSPIERRRVTKLLKVKKHQKIFFSFIDYQDFKPVYADAPHTCTPYESINYISLFAGIANTKPIEEYLKRKCSTLKVHKFADHHSFSIQELQKIKNEFNAEFTKKKVLVTTEKDMMRLQSNDAKEVLKDLPLFYVPIKFNFHKQGKNQFNDTIFSYLEKNAKKDMQTRSPEQ